MLSKRTRASNSWSAAAQIAGKPPVFAILVSKQLPFQKSTDTAIQAVQSKEFCVMSWLLLEGVYRQKPAVYMDSIVFAGFSGHGVDEWKGNTLCEGFLQVQRKGG